MANLPPGDPKLVSQIVNHLKSQGLFDQFRRDCLADVDTKPAYQNLRQRVDNFVTNHLASHTWSPHLNKNQLRNNIRQQVLKSGMLESGIDRIISQVVDPKINHTFRPQVEKVVQEFLATLNNKEDACVTLDEHEERAESFTSTPGSLPVVAASTSVASDAMSILETISSLNQEATAARALTETTNHKNEKAAKKLHAQQSVDVSLEKDHCFEDTHELEKPIAEVTAEVNEAAIKQEDVHDIPSEVEEVKLPDIEADGLIESKDAPGDTEEQRPKAVDKSEKKPESIEKTERKEEKKESKLEKKNEHLKKSDEGLKVKEEKLVKERDHEVEQVKHTAPEKNSAKQKTNDVPKDELSLDSDLDAYSDITVSSVHTSDLSSFDEESDEESAVSDSTEEGEITSDDEEKMDVQSKPKTVTEPHEPKPKATRHSYVHKPFLYSKYYSDSDDELTVEQRRQSAAKEKEERLLRRRMKRERLEEKRKLKAAEKKKALKMKSQDIEPKSSKGTTAKSSSIKEVLKEQMFLEKKVALSKKKSRDSRTDKSDVRDTDEDSKESEKKSEVVQVLFEKAVSSPKEVKPYTSKSDLSKPYRKLLDAGDDQRPEKDPKKKVLPLLDRSQLDNETQGSRKLVERRDSTTEDQQKPKILSKPEKHSKKEGGDSEMQNKKSIPKKDPKLLKTDRERSFSEDRLPSRHRSKSESTHKGSEDFEHRVRKKEDDILQKHGQNKSSSEERSDRKSKPKNDIKPSTHNKDEKAPSTDQKYEEDPLKDSHKRERYHSIDKSKSEHRYKRSLSDARPLRDSPSSSKHHSSSQRKSKTHSEDKNDGESANSDSSSKLEEGSHKDKRRTTSMDEKLSSKAMKTSKPLKPSDQEDVIQKSEREKSSIGVSVEKHRKLKTDEKESESKMDSVPQTSNSISKESGHKSKPTGEKAKERTQNENRERLSFKMDKKYVGENAKGSSSRHSQKDIKRREDGSKYEEKTGKSDDKKSRERGSSIDGKSNKKSIIELKGESSKATLVKKSSKVESENEGVGSPGDRVKVSTSSICTEAKEERSSNVGHSTESAEARQATDLKEAAEPVVEDSLTASNSQDLQPHSEASKGFSLKSKSKHGSFESKPSKLSNTCRKVSPIIPTVDFHTTDNLITLTPCENARKRVPCSNTAADVSNGGTENARNSSRKSRNTNHSGSDAGVPQTSARELQSSAQESNVRDRSSLNPFATLREISVLNDSEISTSDSTNREEDYSQKRAVTESSSSKPVPEEVSELDNTVSGNDVEGDSVMDVDFTDSNGVNIANDPVFHEEENVCVSVSSAEASVQSSILQTSVGGTNNVSPTFSRSVPSLRIFDHVSRIDIEDAATSSSMSVITPTSSVIQSANSRSDGTNSENVRVSFGSFREYTASTTADDGNYSGDVDVALLSDNSFEGASTSSSNCQATCTEGLFSDTSQAPEKDTATSSQGANYVSLEEARSSDNSAMDAATSSGANRILSGDSQDNAATSSDNAEMNAGTLEISEVITRAATSSDGTPEIDSVPVVSEDGVMHAATSSDSVAESETVESASENVISHSATSSDSASESDDSVPGVSENVIAHAATSSSNVVDSSRGLNAEGSVASSETDNENSAASSSNFMDSSLSDSRMWLKKSSERDEDAASSSSAPTRNRQIEHKVTDFENVEDGRNINATSSTQHDGAFDDRFMEVMSSGTVKEYPANSSDVAMDSSSEASGSVRRDMHSGSSSSCTSSGRAQSHAEGTEGDQEKAKYNDTASSSAEDIVALRTPFHVANDEAASSSSSYTYNPTLHTMDTGALSSENTEAAASSSFVSRQCVAVIPGNSSDSTATSSNSTDLGAADVCEANLGNTQATTSSSVAMDSSTSEDLDTRIVSGTDHRSNTATSSSSPSTIPKETRVGPSEKDIRVTASSSTVAGGISNESLDTVQCVERSNDNAATSSDMLDVRIDNSFHALSNNTICATTSTNNKSDAANTKEMDGGFVCEINSEATAATSSSAMDNSGDNATSSNYLMECNAEGQSASPTTCPSKHEEAASSSGLFSGMRLQELRPQEPVSNEATEDATSSERSSEPFLDSRDTIESKDTNIAEGAAESSFVASRNGSSDSLAGTAERYVQLLVPSTNSDAELAVNSEDAANHASHKSSDEKEDAVSSASSDEQRICCNNSRQSILQTGELDTDGAVTSVGTEMNDSSINESIVASGHVAIPHSGDHDVGQAAAACEDEESAVSHTSDAEMNENRAYEINPEDVVLEESESALSPENRHEIVVNVAEPEAERPMNSVMLEEGEGAVTSTGITEENYSEKRRPGIGEGDSSCSCTGMDMANVLNRQEPRDLGAIIEDDETAITSTGAKDEEEGEGFVTSTGTASEDSSFSSGVEENTNNGVINISEMSSENVYVDAEKDQPDLSGPEEAEESTGEQEMLQNADVNTLRISSGGETGVISDSSQDENGSGQISCEDIRGSEHTSILKEEQEVESQNTLTQELLPVGLDQIGPPVLTNKPSEPTSCTNDIVVDQDDKDANCELSDISAVVSPEELDASVTCVRDELDAMDSHSASDREASSFTADAPVSLLPAYEPVEPASHHGDIGTALEPIEPASHHGDIGTALEPIEPASHHGDISTAEPVEHASHHGDISTAPEPVEPASRHADIGSAPEPVEPASHHGDLGTAPEPVEPASHHVDIGTAPEPVEPASHHADIGTAPEPVEPASHHGDIGSAPEPVEPASHHGNIGTAPEPAEPAPHHEDIGTAPEPAEPASHHGDLGTAPEPVEPASPHADICTAPEPVEPASHHGNIGTAPEPAEPASHHEDIGTAPEPAEPASHHGDLGTAPEPLEPASHHGDIGTAPEPVEPASHGDIGTAPEPVEQSSCEFSDVGSLDAETGKNKTCLLTEDASKELDIEKTEDLEKEEDDRNVSISDTRPVASVPECNPVADLSGASEETKNKDSIMENQGESNSEIANEDAGVSCRENKILQDFSQTNDSSTDNKEEDNEDDTTTFTNVEAEPNGQETTVLSKGVSTPSEKAPAAQSQETPEPHQPEEKCAVQEDESGSPRLLEPSEQETAAQSSEANEEQTPVHQKKQRGRKRLEKAKDEEKPVEEANQTVVRSLKTEEIEPKAEPRKRGRPPKKRKLAEMLEQTAKNKLSPGGSSTEGQEKSQENAQGRKVTPYAVTPEKTVGKSEDNSEKGSEPVRRRGRKPKSSMSLSETEGSDPEKKRKKSQSEEEKNDDEEGSENEDEDDHRGATTRAASRLEAQRKLPHKPTTRAASKLGSPEPSASKARRRKEKTSPESTSKQTAILKSKTQQAHGAKRPREASPPLVRTRTQQTEEVPAKRIKRQ
uniref:Biorientation of chromosomes in cell division 1 like 1 n=1 Tax=Leptobrachium leishanense TaxID=445787 RepID=A0A8C5P7N5_9ANUR